MIAQLISILCCCLVATYSVLPNLAAPRDIKPVIVWITIQEETIAEGESTQATVFLSNPFEDLGKYEVKIRLENKDESFPIASGIFWIPSYSESTLNVSISPPYPGSWRVVVSALVINPRPKYFMENWVDLEVDK